MKKEKAGKRRSSNGIHILKLRQTQRIVAMLLISYVLIITAASWAVALLDGATHIAIPKWVLLILVCLPISIGSMLFIVHTFLRPLDRLAESMDEVAKGDFSVRIDGRSSLKEMNRLFDNFNTMTSELSSTEILQSDFAANVSHEFKTPINAIEGYATLLQSCDDVPEEMSEYVEKILFNTGRLSSLVGNILLLSKVDNRTFTGSSSLYRLDEQIRLALMQFERAWEEKQIDLDIDLDETVFFGNEQLITHVWTNLISNAIKFSPAGGTIKMRLFCREESIIFTIDDSGPGLSDAAMQHMFDKFYQGDTSHKAEGNGLGLALVQRILLTCSGEVSAENLSPRGCRFTVTLPSSEKTD